MECIIPGSNLKVLAKALQALSKIGDELYIEAQSDRIAFITLNSSKTICARFHFLENFFSSYEVSKDDSSTSATLNCKVHLKVFLPLFKGTLEKKLEYVKLDYENDSDFMLFKMKYKCDDIMMVHKLRLMDNETLSIGVASDGGGNNIAASSAFYNQLLLMFNTSDDEITLEITTDKVIVRNYCLGAPCRPKMMRSQISLNPSEFLLYDIKEETSINFSLRPFRTLISFAEFFNLNIEFNFDVGGKPLSVLLKNPTFEVNFIVATLNPHSDGSTSVASSADPIVNKVQPLRDKVDFLTELEAVEPLNWVEDVSSESNGESSMKKPRNDITDLGRIVFSRCCDPTFNEAMLGEPLALNSDSE